MPKMSHSNVTLTNELSVIRIIEVFAKVGWGFESLEIIGYLPALLYINKVYYNIIYNK